MTEVATPLGELNDAQSGTPKAPLSIVLIEDNRLLRDGISAMLRAQPGLVLAAACADGETAVARADLADAAVVLLDFGLADEDSLQVCRRLRALAPATHVIVMGVAAMQEDVAEFIRAGASGFIMKDASLEEFVSTVRFVADGHEVLPRALTHSLFAQIVRDAEQQSPMLLDDGVRLTAREHEIVELLGEGLSNKEIAARMQIALHTVKSHVHHVLEKLSLTSRLEVAAATRGQGRPRA